MDRFGHLYGHLSLKDIVRFSARTFISLLPDFSQYYGHIRYWFCRDSVIRITRPPRHSSTMQKTFYPNGRRFFAFEGKEWRAYLAGSAQPGAPPIPSRACTICVHRIELFKDLPLHLLSSVARYLSATISLKSPEWSRRGISLSPKRPLVKAT